MMKEIRNLKKFKSQFDHEIKKKEKMIAKMKKQMRTKIYDNKDKRTKYENDYH